MLISGMVCRLQTLNTSASLHNLLCLRTFLAGPTSKQMMLGRLVAARASFTALSTTSLPLLAKKKVLRPSGTIRISLSNKPTCEEHFIA